MLNCIKKLFERRRTKQMVIKVKRIDDFPEICGLGKKDGGIPAVELTGNSVVIHPHGYSEFPITCIRANADIDILAKEQIRQKLKEADVEFIYRSAEGDDWYLGHAEHYQTEDGDWRWRITYLEEKTDDE